MSGLTDRRLASEPDENRVLPSVVIYDMIDVMREQA